MKKRILALSLAAALVVGAMASCTKTEEEVSSTVEARDITLTLWGSEADQEFLKTISSEWATKYTSENDFAKSVTVDVQIVGEDTATTEATKDLTAAADLFGVANDQLSTLVPASAIYALPDDIATEVTGVVGESSMASTLYDGKYYGFPYAPNTAEILFYNKSMYTEDEVKSLNAMLDKDLGGVTNLVADVDSAWNNMTWFATAGAKIFTGGDKTVNTLNDAKVTKMMEWLQSMGPAGAKKIVDTNSNTDAAALLKDGKAAAVMYGSWSKADFQTALGDNYGVTKLPTLTVEGVCDNQQMTCFGGSKMLCINAQSKEPEAALALAQYIISEDAQLKRFEMVGQTPTAVALADNEKIAADPAVAAEVAQGAFTVVNDPLGGTADIWNTNNVTVGEIFNGTTAAADIQAKLDELVATHKTNLGL